MNPESLITGIIFIIACAVGTSCAVGPGPERIKAAERSEASGNPRPTWPEEKDPVAVESIHDMIGEAAVKSSCASYSWKNRGRAPKGYIKGMAITYARAFCQQTRDDVRVVANQKLGSSTSDALAHYGLPEGDRLRQTYALMIGLGMRESSGKHCCGRDMSATNVSAETAEAGVFQTSWNSRRSNQELQKLFYAYREKSRPCLLDVFREGVSCSDSNWKSWGTGDGFEFQEMSKACPAFATEYAAVMMRVNAGTKGHYGPLRRKETELRPECDAMLSQIEQIVSESPELCRLL